MHIVDYPHMLMKSKPLSVEDKQQLQKLYESIRLEFKKRPVKIIMPCRLERTNEN